MDVRTTGFGGSTFDAEQDGPRLGRQLQRVLDLMRDGGWRSVPDVALTVGCSETSASARLRDLRKPKFGGWIVERRRVDRGLWEYRVLAPPPAGSLF